jgi:hypothetical protein
MIQVLVRRISRPAGTGLLFPKRRSRVVKTRTKRRALCIV